MEKPSFGIPYLGYLGNYISQPRGKIVANVTVDGKTETNAVAKFENTYYGEEPNSPPTGDHSNAAFWFIMMLVSGTACVVLVVLDKRYMTK